MVRIDAHQHFWALDRNDYDWLTPDLEPLYKDFLPQALLPLLKKTSTGKTILVQAAATEAETIFLLNLANQHDFIAGVVGWVDFEAKNAADRVGLMKGRGVLGLRPMVQNIADTNWLLCPALQSAVDAMVTHNLRFDALIQPRHLGILDKFADKNPDLQIVVDHAAKPDIASGNLNEWVAGIGRLAQNPAIYCKLSGLVTEAGAAWTASDLKPIVDTLLDAFGPQRLIWGSDWPVVNLASDYVSWVELCDFHLTNLTIDERAAVFGGNAARFYGIPK